MYGMRKRLVSLTLAVCLALTLIPAASARSTDAPPDDYSVNDALFFGYMKQLARRERGDADALTFRKGADAVDNYAASTAGNRLSEIERRAYDVLKAEIAKVAAGERESTEFEVSMRDLGIAGRSWTLQELGVSIDYSRTLSDSDWNAIEDAVFRQLGYETSDTFLDDCFHALLADCPYELYWFYGYANEQGVINGIRLQSKNGFLSVDGDRVTIEENAALVFKWAVAFAYASPYGTERYNPYAVDASRARQAASAATAARRIILENANKGDYEKLKAYKDEICELVSYNTYAATVDTAYYNINPWQLIWVFDMDPSTNVVCEGYAKAFQYLCELSTFQGDVTSYLITGDCAGRYDTPGGHMWNHVKINGKTYLVDVTNCDGDEPDDSLFMKPPSVQEVIADSLTYGFLENGKIYAYYSNLGSDYNYHDESIFKLSMDPYREPALYAVTVQRGSASDAAAYAGKTVTVTAEPAPDGQRFQSWTGVEDLSFTEGDARSPRISFVMPERDVLLSATYEDASAATYRLTVENNRGRAVKEFQYHAGASVRVEASPADDEYLAGWTGLDRLSAVQRDFSSGVLAFTMPDYDVNISEIYRPLFSDVNKSNYFYAPVLWAVREGITNGTTDTTFSPQNTCTRGHILTFLWRANGSPEASISNPFPDVTPDRFFYQAALWAYEQGLIDGATFGGDTPCTRAEAVTYLWKLAGRPVVTPKTFADVPSDSEYARAVSWAYAHGVTQGRTETTFDPDGICTRAQIVTFLYRAYVE